MENVQISDYNDTNKVVQANELIRKSTGNINTVALKTFRLLISCIDAKNPPKDYSVYVTKDDLLSFSGAQGKGELSYLKKQLNSLITAINLTDEDGEYKTVALLTSYSWKANSNVVKCTFHEDVWPYLTDLQKMFTQYNILQIKEFRSKFSIILYENLLSYTRQTGTKSICMSMKTLRYITGTEKKYKSMKDFEKNVLKVAQEEINNDPYIEFLFSYEKKRTGHEISDILFFLRKRTSMDDSLEYAEYPDRLKEAI